MLIVMVSLATPTAVGPPPAEAPAQNTGSRTVWDGVYTEAQAARGQTHGTR